MTHELIAKLILEDRNPRAKARKTYGQINLDAYHRDTPKPTVIGDSRHQSADRKPKSDKADEQAAWGVLLPEKKPICYLYTV